MHRTGNGITLSNSAAMPVRFHSRILCNPKLLNTLAYFSLLPEKNKQKLDVSNEGPSSRVSSQHEHVKSYIVAT